MDILTQLEYRAEDVFGKDVAIESTTKQGRRFYRVVKNGEELNRAGSAIQLWEQLVIMTAIRYLKQENWDYYKEVLARAKELDNAKVQESRPQPVL